MPIVSAPGGSGAIETATTVSLEAPVWGADAGPQALLQGEPTAWLWPAGVSPQEAWRRWALETVAWLNHHSVDPREAWIVLPVGALLAQARQAWAQAVGGWLPRIDTIAGLVDAQRWAFEAPAWDGVLAEAFAGPVTLDSMVDRLQARRSLGGQTWARQWARRDPRGFDFAVDQVVDAAQTWLRTLQACAPGQRGARVAAWRDALPGAMGQGPGNPGPGHREALLLAWALEWAAASAQQGFASDALFAQAQAGAGEAGALAAGPTAWVAVHAGDTVAPGSEGALTLAVLAHAAAQGLPVRRVVARASGPADAACGALSGRPGITVRVCDDALDEARQAAASVVLAVNEARGHGASPPVALIALDRGVVRHARALLDDAGVSVADETGWRLSTTRAASVCSRLLAAANPRASTDELLDWLKSGWLRQGVAQVAHGCGGQEAAAMPSLDDAVGQLEAWCRRHGLVSAWGLAVHIDADGPGGRAATDGRSAAGEAMEAAEAARRGLGRSLSPAGAQVWRWARDAVQPLQVVWRDRRAHLSDWLVGLNAALQACGARQSLLEDAAGQLAWTALRLDDFPGAGLPAGGLTAWQALCQRTRMDGAAVQRWVREVLEDVTFRPAAPEGGADVVITTLARSVLRPFSAVVMPGADERQLGALPPATGWLSQRLREAMGLSTPAQLREAQWEAWQLLLTQPQVRCLHRRAQGSEPLEASPWLTRWAQAQAQGQGQGDAMVQVGDPRPDRSFAARPTPRPAPSLRDAPVGLPPRVSATTYEQLRQCPYRFFAASVLGLRQADELEEGLEASDYGIWLHEVLRRFHVARQQALALSHAEEDVAQWLAVAGEVSVDLGMAGEGARAHFLPYAAALPALARSYVAWLRAHEDAGWDVRATEQTLTRALPLADGSEVLLHGQLDRIDVRHEVAQDGEAGQARREVRWVLDYKTGNAESLRQRAQSGSEDTQLAFYAALGADELASSGVRAGYLHLDPKAVRMLEHEEVADSAATLLHGLAADWQRLREGSPLPALGEGTVCGHCHARGLCRRDHWMNDALAPAVDEEAGDGR